MKDTAIDWCDSSINGSSGCDGCELWNATTRTCYAGQVHENRLAKSLPALYAADFSEVRMIPRRYQQAANWSDLRGKPRLATFDAKGRTKTHAKPWLDGRPRHIFVGDMGDFLSDAVTDEYLERELLGAIKSTNGQRHVWMLLTKRPERMAELSIKWGGLPGNVIAMTTVTNQRTWNVRVPHLLRVKCQTRMISAEPLLGFVKMSMGQVMKGFPKHITAAGNAAGAPLGIHGVICGGESGSAARPMHPEWARSLRDQCVSAEVPFFFKQWGEYAPCDPPVVTNIQGKLQVTGTWRAKDRYVECKDTGQWALRVGKSAAGRILDGREWNEMPS